LGDGIRKNCEIFVFLGEDVMRGKRACVRTSTSNIQEEVFAFGGREISETR